MKTQPGTFYSIDADFSRKTHTVTVAGKIRDDYELRREDDGRMAIVFPAMTEDEIIDVQIARKG